MAKSVGMFQRPVSYKLNQIKVEVETNHFAHYFGGYADVPAEQHLMNGIYPGYIVLTVINNIYKYSSKLEFSFRYKVKGNDCFYNYTYTPEDNIYEYLGYTKKLSEITVMTKEAVKGTWMSWEQFNPIGKAYGDQARETIRGYLTEYDHLYNETTEWYEYSPHYYLRDKAIDEFKQKVNARVGQSLNYIYER